jgi:hypothetical protein
MKLNEQTNSNIRISDWTWNQINLKLPVQVLDVLHLRVGLHGNCSMSFEVFSTVIALPSRYIAQHQRQHHRRLHENDQPIMDLSRAEKKMKINKISEINPRCSLYSNCLFTHYAFVRSFIHSLFPMNWNHDEISWQVQ